MKILGGKYMYYIIFSFTGVDTANVIRVELTTAHKSNSLAAAYALLRDRLFQVHA